MKVGTNVFGEKKGVNPKARGENIFRAPSWPAFEDNDFAAERFDFFQAFFVGGNTNEGDVVFGREVF